MKIISGRKILQFFYIDPIYRFYCIARNIATLLFVITIALILLIFATSRRINIKTDSGNVSKNSREIAKDKMTMISKDVIIRLTSKDKQKFVISSRELIEGGDKVIQFFDSSIDIIGANDMHKTSNIENAILNQNTRQISTENVVKVQSIDNNMTTMIFDGLVGNVDSGEFKTEKPFEIHKENVSIYGERGILNNDEVRITKGLRAIKKESNEKQTLTADSGILFRKNNVAVFNDRVKVVAKKFNVTSNYLKVYTDSNNDKNNIKDAVFFRDCNLVSDKFIIKSDAMYYNELKKTLVFYSNVYVVSSDKKNNSKGEIYLYNTQNDTIFAVTKGNLLAKDAIRFIENEAKIVNVKLSKDDVESRPRIIIGKGK